MRYNKAHSRVLAIITAPEVPRRADGHIRLCQYCQRQAFWRGGFMELLTHDLELLGRLHCVRESRRRIA